MPNDAEALKIIHFKKAMQHYENKAVYTLLERLNSIVVITLQLITFLNLFTAYDKTHPSLLLFSFLLAYLATDFINGLVHMYMDNNTHYTSWIGPLISVFHLHHAKLQYKNRHPLQIYYYESGTKFWLSGYLIVLLLLQHHGNLYYAVNFGMVCIGILSSVAELSHYWCHNSTSKNSVINWLQKYRILLSKKHHFVHHRNDNKQYAFLNGLTDPLLNKIANYFYAGYKNNADKHVQAYMKDTH